MTCDRLKERLPEYWTGSLPDNTRRELEAHLAACSGCREEADNLSAIWNLMGELPEAQPSRTLAGRFRETLAAYEAGQAAGRPERRARSVRLVLRLSLAAAMLLIGFGMGHLLTKQRQDSEELAALRSELTHMRHLVALSLLQQQSASDRLRGVTYSVAANTDDTEVLSALLYTLKHDPNVNVRLAAADALRSFRGIPLVRQSLPDALAAQNSPLVQIALVDLIADLGDPMARAALRKAAHDETLAPVVRDRALKAIKLMQEGGLK